MMGAGPATAFHVFRLDGNQTGQPSAGACASFSQGKHGSLAAPALGGRSLATLQDGADPRQQDFLPNRLAEEIGRTDLETPGLHLGTGDPGDEHGRRLDPFLNHDLEQTQSAECRDIDVEQQEVELSASDLDQRVGAVPHADHPVASLGQVLLDESGRDDVVFNQEYQHRPIDRITATLPPPPPTPPPPVYLPSTAPPL